MLLALIHVCGERLVPVKWFKTWQRCLSEVKVTASLTLSRVRVHPRSGSGKKGVMKEQRDSMMGSVHNYIHQEEQQSMHQQILELKPLAFSINHACRLLGLSRWTICRLIKMGLLKSCKVGRRVLIPSESIDRLLQGLP
jgi:excisionase family DNA binding protein